MAMSYRNYVEDIVYILMIQLKRIISDYCIFAAVIIAMAMLVSLILSLLDLTLSVSWKEKFVMFVGPS